MNLYERSNGKSLLPMYSNYDSKRIKKLVNTAKLYLNTHEFGLACKCRTLSSYSKINNNIGYFLQANTYTGRNVDDFLISTELITMDGYYNDLRIVETDTLHERLYKVKIGFLKLVNFRSSKRIDIYQNNDDD